ncbi:hypothetical protein ACFV9C_38740 [Kribbella sp. NPDC059898]|uniref:hypothetical protein n=1 Tax=Kribbella sp. NPDC059898 TaxID=3346995 RepID=UPI0036657CA4
MTQPQEPDSSLADRIAAMMRAGVTLAAALLVAGVLSRCLGATRASVVLLMSGCGALILLPVARLVMMFGHFVGRANASLAVVTALVILLIIAGSAVGIGR